MTAAEVEVNRQGRLTIPAALRRALGLHEGSRLIAWEDNGRIVLEPRAHLLARIQDRLVAEASACGYVGSVVDELISERRAEVIRESAT